MVDFAQSHLTRVLVVDNDEHFLAKARLQLSEERGFYVRCERDKRGGRAALDNDSFDACLIDVRLNGRNESGLDLARHAITAQPCAVRFVVSRLFSEDYSLALAASKLGRLVEKSNELNLVDVLAQGGVETARPRVTCNSCEGLLDAVVSNSRRWPKKLTEQLATVELYRLFTDLFGDQQFVGKDGTVSVELVHIFDAGRSSSAVAEVQLVVGRDANGDDVPGSRVVLKIGKPEKLASEAERFARTVRYGVPGLYRTELLGSVTTNRLGAASYAMAGGTAGSLVSLQEEIDRFIDGDESAIESIAGTVETTFGSVLGRWRTYLPAEDEPLGAFFVREADWDGNESMRRVDSGLDQVAKKYGVAWKPRGDLQAADFGEVELLRPTRAFLGRGVLSPQIMPTLVHGDLHGGNVLISEGRVYPIDYARSGLGPRWIDQAALSGTIRFSDARRFQRSRNVQTAIAATLEDERRIASMLEIDSRWGKVARLVDSVEGGGAADGESMERLATYLLHASSLLSYPNPAWLRLRILIWFTALAERVAELDS